ncbi:putative trans-cinnamate 4-monooxygenase [Helianthus anomalus]
MVMIMVMFYRRFESEDDPLFLKLKEVGEQKSMDNKQLKCAIDHILEAMEKGEISEVNVLYIAENINVAGMLSQFITF